MSKLSLRIVLGGAFASALLALGFSQIAQRFDPVLQQAIVAPAIQVASYGGLPSPTPAPRGGEENLVGSSHAEFA